MPNRRISENINNFENTLENAIENVKFYADSTWSSTEYQKANQGLLKQTEELEHVVRKSSKARNVRDSIPDSKLASYSNYEYDEARELCYASSVSDISFYYPCIYKRDCIVEPWMLPEVEQIFIWLTYSADFSLLESLSTEDLERVDDSDKPGSERHCSNGSIFHEIKPLLYESVERAPGKSRYTQCFSSRSDSTNSFFESKLKNVDLDEMIVENRIKCENVKRLWSEFNLISFDEMGFEEQIGEKEDTLNVFKSSLGNCFIFENIKNIRNISNLFKIDANCKSSQTTTQEKSLDSLKSLNDSFTSLEETLLNYSAFKNKYSPINENPGRRLYSAVVQGAPTKPLALSKINESTDTLSLTNIRSVLTTEEIDEQKNVPQKLPLPFNFCQHKYQRDLLLKKTKESLKSNSASDVNTFTSSGANRISGMLTSASSNVSSTPFGGNTHTTPSSAHLFLNSYNPSGNCLMNICGNTYLHNYNSFTPNHAVIQSQRQTFTNNMVAHQPLWLLQQQQQQQLRHQTYYPSTNCPGFVYLPSPARSRLPHRWPPFFKPLASTIPSSSSAPLQSWGQNSYLCKGNSAQYFANKQSTEYSRSKMAGSRQTVQSSKMDRNSKSNVDETSKECPNKNLSCSSDNISQTPQSSTRIRYFYRSSTNNNTADELERQAIEQYQLNDENCKELEQQAIEQYENSENWISPSNKFVLFGGLLYRYILSTLYRHLFVVFKIIVTY